jgi:hypothetical protein
LVRCGGADRARSIFPRKINLQWSRIGSRLDDAAAQRHRSERRCQGGAVAAAALACGRSARRWGALMVHLPRFRLAGWGRRRGCGDRATTVGVAGRVWSSIVPDRREICMLFTTLFRRRSVGATMVAVAGIAVAVALAPVHAQTPPVGTGTEPFEFVAFGDVPYRTPQDFPKFDRLIDAINGLKPAFSLHVGDIKSASEPCTDEYFKSMAQRFQRFEQPLVYTPGDNEWTDCYRERAGRYNPRERLDKLREIFFAEPTRSLGKAPMAVEAQGKLMVPHAKYVENVRFWRNGVLFLTVHVVGSNNGFETTELEAASEFFDRNKANVAWLDDSFKQARERPTRAIVIAMHAHVGDIKQKFPAVPLASGFVDTIRAIERGARGFGKPMLVIHGDEHEFELDGFRGTDYKRIPNVWRMQVMGDAYVHAVRVTVDPASPSVFSFRPFIVPENGAY